MPLILDTLDVQALATFRASSTSLPSLRVPHGTAPTSPTNGDIWTTTAGIFVRVNGVTIGPLSTGGGGANKILTFADSPYTVLATDGFLLVNTTGGAITINFPSAATAASIVVKDTHGMFSTNNVTLVPNGSDKFDNLSGNLVLSANFYGRTFRSDSTLAGWFRF
jgi:hypothetical protein